MTRNREQEWKSRREIPDPQVRDAADQYEAAHELLSAQPPGSGVLLPSMNTAAVAIELYLKCLSAETLHVPTGDDSGCVTVHAAPVLSGKKGHELTALFDKIPDDVRSELERAFQSATGDGCRDMLARCEGVFSASRYPFEAGMDLSSFHLPTLMRLSRFLRKFVAGLEPRETIQWRDPEAAA